MAQGPRILEGDARDRQPQADQEPPRHVYEFGVRPGPGGSENGLERHAADRAVAGAGLPDLRMHRAGIDGPFRNWSRRRFARLRAEIFRRLGGKLGLASRGTEVIGATLMGVAIGRLVRIDLHAADRVDRALSGGDVAPVSTVLPGAVSAGLMTLRGSAGMLGRVRVSRAGPWQHG